jgi:RNA polymerase sigma factor (sigma-70 family)
LLARFLRREDVASSEAAFAALVERHGPMVVRVCSTILHDPHDAEDAFQATFLILMRRAGSIRKRGSAASWLHGVARRVACCARTAGAKRRVHEGRSVDLARRSSDAADWDDRPEIIHEELSRLPNRYRMPIVLCDLEDLTEGQAALSLGWPIGTVRSRLARGRDHLRGRLARRGLAPWVGVLGPVLFAKASDAAVPAKLANSTIQAAMRVAAGGLAPPSVAPLVQGVLKMMILTRLKMAAALALILAVTSAGVIVAGQRARTDRPATALGGVAVVGVRSQPEAEGVRTKDLLDAARESYEMTIKDIGAGRLKDIEVIYRWSRRWMDAQHALSKTAGERVAAAEAHLKRMKDIEKAAQQLAELNLGGERFPSSSAAAARYYRVEAEGFLSELAK